MRFVLLYKSGRPEKNEPPSPQEMHAVGSLVQEMAQAGVPASESWVNDRVSRAPREQAGGGASAAAPTAESRAYV